MVNKRSRKRRGPGMVATLRDPDKIRIAYVIAGLALVFGGSLSFGSGKCDRTPQGPGGTQPSITSELVAEIEDRNITWAEYEQEFDSFRQRAEASSDAVLHPPEWEASIRYTALRQMLDMEYFDLRAEQSGITVSNEAIDQKVEEYRNNLMPQIELEPDRSILQRISDALSSVKEDKAFEMRLRQLNPNLTVVKLREYIRQEQLAQEYVAQITREQDAEILGELMDEAMALRDEIAAGKSFADAAMERSEHADSSAAGGLIPIVKRGESTLPEPVLNAAFNLPLNELSLPLEVTLPVESKGYWLVTVINRKEASGEEWEAVRESIQQQLLEEKRARIEAGEEQMPEDGNIVIEESAITAAYEEATIRVIFLKAEDPMERVRMAVEEDQKNLRIVIHDPELRAMHHALQEQWDLAAADYQEALKINAERLDPTDENQYAVNLKEAQLRYLLANLWATVAYRSEAQWMQNKWTEFQENPDAFAGTFPEVPDNIKAEQQAYFVLALVNLNRSIELEPLDPWSHWQRAQIDIARKQLTSRFVEDVGKATEYLSSDLDTMQRVLSVLSQAIAMDNESLEAAGGIRPATFVDPPLAENELGLALEQLDAPFVALIEQALAQESMGTPNAAQPAENVALDEVDLMDTDISASETEPQVAGSAGVAEMLESATNGELPSITTGADRAILPAALLNIRIPEVSGPYTQEHRDTIDHLQELVQQKVDQLTAERQAAEAERQAQLDEMQRQFEAPAPENSPVEVEPAPSEEAANLLNEGAAEGEEETGQ